VSNIVCFQPSSDPTVTPSGTYIIEGAASVNGPWVVVAQLSAALSGENWNAQAGVFEYHDDSPFRPYSTWYHVIDMDLAGTPGRPSDPFMTHPTPYFVAGQTPFGVFDADPQFAADADRVCDFVRKKMGEPVLEVYLSSSQVYASFEQACLEYSAMVNSYQAKSVLATYLGSPTGTLSGSENKFPKAVLALEQQQADPWAAEGNLNSSLTLFTGSVQLNCGQQTYDIPGWISTHDISGNLVPSGSTTSSAGLPVQWDGVGHIRLREVYHNSPLQAYRFFGTTSGLNYLNNQFRFESFTPETLFYLLPIWEDVLRGMQFKTSNNVRRSNYSFDLHDNCIRIYPVPAIGLMLWFTYTIDATPMNVKGEAGATQGAVDNPGYSGVSNLSNIPFGNIQYSLLNSISKQWIWNMALAFSKEVEGTIRSKMTNIPIPNGDLTLNGPQMIQDARADMEQLRAELKELLEETTYQKLMEQEAQKAQNLLETWKGAPMGIYIG
jgi:hypothetical protein